MFHWDTKKSAWPYQKHLKTKLCTCLWIQHVCLNLPLAHMWYIWHCALVSAYRPPFTSPSHWNEVGGNLNWIVANRKNLFYLNNFTCLSHTLENQPQLCQMMWGIQNCSLPSFQEQLIFQIFSDFSDFSNLIDGLTKLELVKLVE